MTFENKLPTRAWLVVALLWLVGCLNYLDRVMITTMRVSIKDAIPMTEAQFGLLTTVFLFVYGALSPFAGFLADRFNRSKVIIASLFAWSLITWLTARATSFDQLLVTRALMGITEACYIPASLALVADYHRGATRSLATGILLGGVIVGSGLGGLGGALAERHSWGYAFTLFGWVGMIYSVALVFWLRDAPREDNAAVTAPVGKEIRIGEAAASLFASRSFVVALAYWGLLGVAGWMVVGWMPTFFQERFHLSQGKAGLITTLYLNIASLFGLLLGGAWADRWSRTRARACVLVSVIGLCAAAPSILIVANTSVLAVAIVGLASYGLARSFADTEMMPILCLFTDTRYRATAFGVLNLFACIVGGATIYAGGAMRDAEVDIGRLFQFGSFGLVACAALLLLVKPRAALSPQAGTQPI